MDEESFLLLQQQKTNITVEIYQLNESLNVINEDYKPFPELFSRVTELEINREEAKKRHKESIDMLHGELSNLKKKMIEMNEENIKRANEKVIEINKMIEMQTLKNKDNDDMIDALKSTIKGFDSRVNSKRKKLDSYREKVTKYQPIIKFLQNSRGLPMLLEDLKCKNLSTSHKMTERYSKETELIKKEDQLRVFCSQLDNKLTSGQKERESLQSKSVLLKERVEKAKNEMFKTEEMVRISEERLINATNESKQAEMNLSCLEKDKQSSLSSLENKYEMKKGEYSELRKSTVIEIENREQSLNLLKVELQSVRKLFTDMKETGIDPDLPRIDRELHLQISNVQEEKNSLSIRNEMLSKRIREAGIESSKLDSLIIKQLLKSEPTPKILASSEFQTKHVLVVELINQNRELRKNIIDANERMLSLKTSIQDIKDLLKQN